MQELGEVLLGAGIFINAVLAVLTYIKALNSAKTIELLEQNTNSIKDALVKVTGESEHAKGVLQGKQEATRGK